MSPFPEPNNHEDDDPHAPVVDSEGRPVHDYEPVTLTRASDLLAEALTRASASPTNANRAALARALSTYGATIVNACDRSTASKLLALMGKLRGSR